MTINISGFFKDPHYPFYLFYQGLILFALVLAYKLYYKSAKNRLSLVLLLPLTLIVELSGDITTGSSWAYYIFNLFEYSLFCMYYLENCKVDRYKWVVKWSIPAFVILSFCVSMFYYHFKSLPSLNINVEGLLLVVIYVHLLFNLDVNIAIYKHPDFWISAGILTYFGGAFAYFTFYRTLLHLNYAETISLFVLISIPLNTILYACITISQICITRNLKYFILSN